LNEPARGDAPHFHRLLDDIVEFLESPIIQAGYPGPPVIVLGVSWGGKLAAALPCYRPGLVKGVSLLCPGFFPRLSWRLRLRSKFLGPVAALMPRLFLPVPLNDPALFTSTSRWQDFLRQDSLALHRATARMLQASRQLDRYLRAVPAQFQLPLLLQLAEHDRIIDNQATRRFVESFACTDLEIIEYNGAQHTLEFEDPPNRHVDDLLAWLQRHPLLS
jgi:alpha-beta hydrolase superfamily lysophospholipase